MTDLVAAFLAGALWTAMLTGGAFAAWYYLAPRRRRRTLTLRSDWKPMRERL